MKNTDLVNYVGYSVGGNSPKGTLVTKVRFCTTDSNYVLRSKELEKMGASTWFVKLPHAMTKNEAVAHLASLNEVHVTQNADVISAINHTAKRLGVTLNTAVIK